MPTTDDWFNVKTQWKQRRLRRGGKNTQKNYTEKALMTRITNSVVTNLEPDMLEWEVKWAFGALL